MYKPVYKIPKTEEIEKQVAVLKYADSRSSDADTIRALIDKAYKRLSKAKRDEIERDLGLRWYEDTM